MAKPAHLSWFSLARSVAEHWREAVMFALLTLAVSTIFGARLVRQPLAGEETRWATGAREMLATGDWIVPRQQGRVFAERPPMTMWAMAAVGMVRGKVDAVAVRLPSVVAVVLTSWLIYGYARAFMGPIAAMAAALVYPTFGQVLQIGRLGESEPMFALLVGASLLLWHLGYVCQWSRWLTWCCGFGFAALAALVKGPQAPVYFGAITAAYLLLRRDWRYVACREFAAGAALFAAIVLSWQIPFYLATDWPTVVAMWSGLAADRMQLRGMATHFLTYPLETFVCLLPWSPLLVALAKRETRSLLGLGSDTAGDAPQRLRMMTSYLLTALLVSYPTVWVAAGARGRYFMPLYPIVAVLVGLMIERCAQARIGGYPRQAWHQFLLLSAVLIGAAGATLGVSAVWPSFGKDLFQPPSFSAAFACVAMVAVFALWRCYRAPRHAPVVAVWTIAGFVGMGFTGAMINVNSARWHDPSTVIAQLKEQLPPGEQLASLTPIEHRFAYYFNDPIEELDWPDDPDDLPPGLDYFCFMRYPGDTAESRAAGRGRSWTTTTGTLPFAWIELGSTCVERRVREGAQPTVVIGRVVKPLVAITTDATVPQAAARPTHLAAGVHQAAPTFEQLANDRTTASNTESAVSSRMQRR